MDVEDAFNDIAGGAFLVLIAGIFIYILLVLGNAFAPLPGGAMAQSTTNYSILAIGAIVTIAGVAGLIKFAQWVSKAFSNTFRY